MATKIKTLDTLLTKEFPKQKWIVEPLIPQGGMVLLSAAPSSYKTWLALEMATKIASGKKFLGHFETNQIGVMLIDEESGERMLQNRFKALQPKENLPIYYQTRTGRKMNDEYVTDILEICQERSIGLVIFDSLIRFHSADENASSQMSEVLNCFKKISDEGISCLILHHNKKKNQYDDSAGGDLMRGSGDILASCDIHMTLKRKDDSLTLAQTKNRYCEEIKPVNIRVESKDDKLELRFLGYEKTREEWDNSVKSDIWDYVRDNAGMKKTELAKKFYELNDGKPGLSKIRSLIERMLKDGDLTMEKGEHNAQYITANDYLKSEVPDVTL